MRHQLFDIFRALHGQVITKPRADQYLLDALETSCLSVHLNQRAVIGGQVAANARKNTAGFSASRFNFWTLAAQSVHVGGGATQVRNNTRETFDFVANVFNFAQHRSFAATLDNASLVLCDGAKSTAAKTTAHDVDRKSNHLPCRNFGGAVVRSILVSINRMRAACIGQIEHSVHFGCGQGTGRRRHPYIACRMTFTMRLNQTPRVTRIGF